MTNPYDDLRALSAQLELSVPVERARARVSAATDTRSRRPRTALVALVTAGLMAVSNVALAAVANPAAPGDALYGVDRAYEHLQNLAGFNSHAAERLAEAAVMAGQGHSTEVLTLVDEALSEVLASPDPAAAVEKLKRKANLGTDFEEQLSKVVDAAHDKNTTGKNHGQAVAELAKQLGRNMAPGQAHRPGDGS